MNSFLLEKPACAPKELIAKQADMSTEFACVAERAEFGSFKTLKSSNLYR